MGDLRSMLKENRESISMIDPHVIAGLMDHLKTNMFHPISCPNGAIVAVNGWSCRIRIKECDQCLITITPEKKHGNEHAILEPHTCPLREVASVIARETAVVPLQRKTHEDVSRIIEVVRPQEQGSARSYSPYRNNRRRNEPT